MRALNFYKKLFGKLYWNYWKITFTFLINDDMKFIWEQLDIFWTQIQRRNCATLQSAALFLRRPVSLTSGAHTSTSSYCVIGTASNKPVNWPRFSGELEDKPKINVNPIKSPKAKTFNHEQEHQHCIFPSSLLRIRG